MVLLNQFSWFWYLWKALNETNTIFATSVKLKIWKEFQNWSTVTFEPLLCQKPPLKLQKGQERSLLEKSNVLFCSFSKDSIHKGKDILIFAMIKSDNSKWNFRIENQDMMNFSLKVFTNDCINESIFWTEIKIWSKLPPNTSDKWQIVFFFWIHRFTWISVYCIISLYNNIFCILFYNNNYSNIT